MAELLNETLIDLRTASRHPALRNTKTGNPCHVAQLYRYIQRGARAANGKRVRLESIVTPGGRKTSQEAIARLVERLTNPELPPPTTRQRQRQQTLAEQELAAAGFEVGGGE